MRVCDSFDRELAQGAEYVGRPKPTEDRIAQARSMSIVRLRKAKYTFTAIARFHGISKQHARYLYLEVPEHVRKRIDDILDPEPADESLV